MFWSYTYHYRINAEILSDINNGGQKMAFGHKKENRFYYYSFYWMCNYNWITVHNFHIYFCADQIHKSIQNKVKNTWV